MIFLGDFASIDVSFISLKKVLPSVWNLLKDNGEVVCLIKPQFEAGRNKVGKNGVVRDKNIHIDVLKDIIDYCIMNNWKVNNITYSPIKGPEGNIEYLIHLIKNKKNCKIKLNKDDFLDDINEGSFRFSYKIIEFITPLFFNNLIPSAINITPETLFKVFENVLLFFNFLIKDDENTDMVIYHKLPDKIKVKPKKIKGRIPYVLLTSINCGKKEI